MAIIRKIPWTIKPSFPQVNFGHPLAKGLQLVVAPIDGTMRDIGPFGVAVTTNTSDITQGKFGHAAKNGPGTDTRVEYAAPPGFDTETSQFILYRLTGDTVGFITDYGATGGDPHCAIFNRGSGTVATLINIFADGASSVPQNTWIDHGVARRLSFKRIYFLGIDDGGDTIVTDHGSGPVTLGNRGSGGDAADIDTALFLQWNRVLDPAEFKSLHENPWQMFQPRTQIIPIEVAVVGGRIMSSLAYSGGLAQKGGIAGKGGGLAGR